MIKIVNNQPKNALSVFVLTSPQVPIRSPVMHTIMESTCALVNSIVMFHSLCTGDGVVLKGVMVFDAEAKVDGLVAGTPTFDDGVLVFAGALFEKAK